MESAKDQGSALAEFRPAFLLTHPLRARIAAELDTSHREPTELAKVLGESLPLVAYHYRVLAAGGWLCLNQAMG
jgi:DNA-binding transcriptional ArsR family regulator